MSGESTRCPVSVLIWNELSTRCDLPQHKHPEHFAFGRKPGLVLRWSDQSKRVWFVGVK